MIFLSKQSFEKKKKSRDSSTEEWVAWDIGKFEKIETERYQASEKRGIDFNAPFQPLYEGKEMAPEDHFVFIYQKERESIDPSEVFQPSFAPQTSPLAEETIQTTEAIPDSETPSEELRAPASDPEKPVVVKKPPPEKKRPSPDVKIDTEGIKQAAYEEGFQKGAADGYQKGLSEALSPVQNIQEILSNIEGLWTRMIRANEEKILKLLGLVMDKIVYGHAELDSNIVRKAVLEAFHLLTEPESAMIYVNSEDYDHINSVKDGFFKEIESLKQVSIIADPAVSPGGCRIVSESGEVDATLESRLDAVKKSIRDALLRAGGPA